jgi:hypothetical protein
MRKTLTAQFTSLEGNQYVQAPSNAGINLMQPGLLNILTSALKPDGYQQKQINAEPGHRGLALSGQNNFDDNNNWIEGDSGIILRDEQTNRLRERTSSLEFE